MEFFRGLSESQSILSTSTLAKAVLTALVGLVSQDILNRARLYLSVKNLPGPPHNGSILGNSKQVMADERAVVANQWFEKYGKVFGVWALFGSREIFLADLKGLSHVLKHDSEIYQKPDHVRYLLGRSAGHGLLVAEGHDHKKQRKVMTPAFGPAQIRGLTEIFIEKSMALRDVWATHIDQDSSAAQIDVLSWLGRMTLDVIGQAGFNYQFDALSGKQNELNEAFSHIFESGNFLSPTILLKLFFPVLRSIPEHNAYFRHAQATSSRIGRELFQQSQKAAQSEQPHDRDLLSLLIRSNMSTDIPTNQRMTDDDVLAREYSPISMFPALTGSSSSEVPTFLAAGHETTSTSTTWALYLLATHPEIQSKLREELLPIPTDSPTMEDLNALPYLDGVVRETLRLLAPVPATLGVAMKDDVIPLDEPYVDIYGKKHHELKVKKGQEISIQILALNKDRSLWGEDAEEFKPERWQSLPEAVSSIPGVWGNLMTFLGGPRSCIGWRFSLVEMRALLFTLIRAYEFELLVPKEDVLIKRAFPVNRPVVRGSKGNELPMIIRPVA
ncbi:hypothetical protein V5O48_006611 [Marasmius crinis-equi]|uniref:Cytochrome P450 n=1 Tax=Marasmius crinis-equi TaxID=585013 RepID=A0ABR3FJ29_9AGAR